MTLCTVLTFDDDHKLVDFVSDDRLRSSTDGRTFIRQRWSTPVTDYRVFDGRRVGALGHARWHPDDEPTFDYLEFHVDGISYLGPGHADRTSGMPVVAPDRWSDEKGALPS